MPRVAGPVSREPLSRALEHIPRFALTGPSGSGKTTALSYLSTTSPASTFLSLADFHPAAPPAIHSHPAGSPLVLLDDASPSNAQFLKELAGLQAKCGLALNQGEEGPAGFTTLTLQEWNDCEVYRFAEPWFPPGTSAHGDHKPRSRAAEVFAETIKAHPQARFLAGNSLNLLLFLQIYAPGRPLPPSRAALFDTYVRAILQAQPDPEFALRALQGIALSVKRGQLAKPDHLARGYGFLVQRPSGRVEFVHGLLLDFFAASALRQSPDLAPIIEHLDEADWSQVLLFYAGLGNAAELVREARERSLYFAGRLLGQWREAPEDLRAGVALELARRAWETQDQQALDALGELQSAPATDFFSAKLKDRSPEVRIRAARALGYTQNDRALEFLLPQLRDVDATVRSEVVRALGRSKSERVLEPLLVTLRGDTRMVKVDDALRIAAAQALGEIGAEKAVPALIVDLQIGQPAVQAATVAALRQIRSQLAVRPLQHLAAQSPKPEVRSAAELVLSDMGDST